MAKNKDGKFSKITDPEKMLAKGSSPYQRWEEIIFEVKAPRDAYYSGYVTVVVRDETMFGTEIVASRDIPLAPYASNSMYDSVNKYRSRAHITDAVRLKQFWHMDIKDKNAEEGEFRHAEISKVDFKNDAEEKEGADDEEEEEEEIEIAEIVPCINLDPDSINMVFDKS